MKLIGKTLGLLVGGFAAGTLVTLATEVYDIVRMERRYCELTSDWIRQFAGESGDPEVELLAERYANGFRDYVHHKEDDVCD